VSSIISSSDSVHIPSVEWFVLFSSSYSSRYLDASIIAFGPSLVPGLYVVVASYGIGSITILHFW